MKNHYDITVTRIVGDVIKLKDLISIIAITVSLCIPGLVSASRCSNTNLQSVKDAFHAPNGAFFLSGAGCIQ